MPARTITTLAATTALAATVLVAAPSAEAKPVSLKSSYTCATALGDQTLTVTTKMNLPTKVKKGKKVPDSTVKMVVVVPETLVTPMRDILGITALSGSATDIKYSVGTKKIPLVKVKIPRTDVPASGSMTLRGSGIAKGFTLKKTGTYAVKIPKDFMFNALDQNGDPAPSSPFPCALSDGAPAKLGSIKVVK